jgi:hypothetical protein
MKTNDANYEKRFDEIQERIENSQQVGNLTEKLANK